MRVENSIRIAKAGIISQVVSILLGFVNRIVFIRFLSSDYLGFSGLFNNILSMLALSELGFGSAIVYNLYKPIHTNDQKQIAGLVNFYRKIYFILALFVFGVGSAFMPFLHVFISDLDKLSFSIEYIRLIYFLSLLETVSSYLLVHRTTLLTVSQRDYIITNIRTISNICLTIARLVVLILTQNYIVYLLIGLVFRIGANVIASRYALKYFPYISTKEYRNCRVDKKEREAVTKNAGNLSVHTLSSYVVNSTDSLIISSFVGIVELGLYSNYNLIFSSIKHIISSVVGSIQAPLGDLVSSENKKRVREILDTTTHCFYMISSFCAVSLAVLSSDFIFLLFGKDYVMKMSMVLISSINVFVWTMTRPIWKLSAVTGLFKEDRSNAIIEAISNAVISLVLVQVWGITGTFVGTLCSYIIAFILKTKLQFRKYFFENTKKYFQKICKYAFVFAVECFLCLWTTSAIKQLWGNVYASFVTNCIVCLVVPNVINMIVYWRCEDNRYFINLINRKILKRRVN